MLKSHAEKQRAQGQSICTCAHFALIAQDLRTPETMSSTEIVKSERKPQKTGRKRFEITPSVLEQVEKYSGLGFNISQIATVLGVDERTVYAKKAVFSQLDQAIKRGRLSAIGKVSNALFDSALSGNVTAQIFYLKNRAPEMYQDVIQNKFTVEAIHKLSDTQLLDEIRKDQEISSQVSGVLPMQSQTQSQDQA